jgi:hypothetical protein
VDQVEDKTSALFVYAEALKEIGCET